MRRKQKKISRRGSMNFLVLKAEGESVVLDPFHRLSILLFVFLYVVGKFWNLFETVSDCFFIKFSKSQK